MGRPARLPHSRNLLLASTARSRENEVEFWWLGVAVRSCNTLRAHEEHDHVGQNHW